jgi:replicative DNA helicase
MTGGLNAGDFVSMVGRPGQGKTWLLLYAALSAWQKLNRPVLFVSMEMNRQIILERMAAMFASIPPDFFKDGLSPTMFGENLQDKLEDKLVSLQNSQSAPFIVLDSKLTATVEDIVSLTQMIQPSAVFIDGAYMLSHPHAKSMYDAVAKNAHLLKGELAERCALPTICTWQFSREADKLKKGETPGLNHIGYSDTIGQLSSIVLGLFEEEEGDNVELHKRRHVHILKGRSGEAGDFYTRWDFKNVDFSEIEDAELQVYEL